MSLNTALNVPGGTLVFTTGGDYTWFEVTPPDTHDGVAAGQACLAEASSGNELVAISHNQSCYVETTVTGPKTIKFWWKVESEEGYDYLEFYTDDGSGPQYRAAISGNLGWEQKAYFLPLAVVYTLRWSYKKDSSVSRYRDTAWLDEVEVTTSGPFPSLDDALNVPGGTLIFTTGGDEYWWSQTVTTHDGIAAGESGDIGNNGETWVETVVDSDNFEIDFFWKVSSETNYDFLKFFIDDLQEVSISGEVDWQNQNFVKTGVGPHTLRWSYKKDSSVSSGSDAGWLDEVEVTIQVPVPGKATVPDPANSATGVLSSKVLSWVMGDNADSHDVYFGLSYPPEFIGNQLGTTYNPPNMNYGSTYYWRIDEVNITGTTTGDDWSFTIESPVPIPPPGAPGGIWIPDQKRGVARVTDRTFGICYGHKYPISVGGTIIAGSSDVKANGLQIARIGDTVAADCGHTGIIIAGSSSVHANSIRFARLNDQIVGTYVSRIITASKDVFAE